MKRLISIIVLSCFSFLIILQDALLGYQMAKQRYTLAVLPLEPSDSFSEEQAIQLGIQLQNEFSQYPVFQTLDPLHVDRILALNQIDPLACSDAECASSVGQILQTQLVAFGQAKKEGGFFVIHLSVLHVKSGQIVKSVREAVDGNFSALLGYLPEMVQKLVGKSAHRSRRFKRSSMESPAGISAAPAMQSNSEETGMNREGETIILNGEEKEVDPASAARIKKGGSGKWLLWGLLVAGGIGAGLYYAQQSKNGKKASSSGLLPAPPSFP